jgi:hypothetical protein
MVASDPVPLVKYLAKINGALNDESEVYERHAVDARLAAQAEEIGQLHGQVEAKEERARYYLRENQELGTIVAALRQQLADAR